MTTATHKEQRKASKLQAAINPDKCGLCRATVTMTTVRVCSQCGGPCCWTSGRYSYDEGTGCNATPGTGRVICKGCECNHDWRNHKDDLSCVICGEPRT